LRTYIVEALAQLPNLLPGRFVAAVKASNTKAKAASSKGKRKQASDDSEASDEENTGKKGKAVSARDALNKTLAEEDHVEVKDGDKNKSLQELREIYGADFRIVADADSIQNALGNVEACPQSIKPLLHYTLRKRGEGASFPEIGDKLKYNVSLIFFQVKGLIDNDLGIKFRAHNGKALVSWVVAKRYAHLCPHLLDSNNEAAQDDDEAQNDNDGEAGDDTTRAADDEQLQEMSSEAVDAMLRGGKVSKQREQSGEEDEEEEADLQEDDIDRGEEERADGGEEDRGLTTLHGLLAYPAIPTVLQQKALMHDRNLIRLRILKLLKSSKNNATIRKDLILRIGVKDPDRFDRKIFNATLRQLEKEELIERCLLKRPLQHQKDHTEQCWMATAKGIAEYEAVTTSSQQRQIIKMRHQLAREVESSSSKITVEASFVRQLLDIVDRCGTSGTTIHQLTRELGGNRDRHRDLDHMLGILKKPTNKYYGDYTIYSALEQSGRVRSQRFWTRRWRPDRLEPQEPREMTQDQMNNWIGLPGEKSFSSMDQWMKRAAGRPKAKPTKRYKGEDDEDDDELDSPAPSQKAKKARTSEMKGRPRKHFTASAERAAQRYQEKKAQKEKEREEQMGVEDLLGETPGAAAPRITRKRKARVVVSEDEQGISTMEGPEDEQSDVQEGRSEESPMVVDAHSTSQPENRIIPIDPALAASPVTPAPALKVPSKSTKTPQAPRKSINLTLQLKYDTLVDFFNNIEIVEGGHFEHEYRKHMRRIVGPNGDTHQYEMDRKVRNKLFHSLEKANVIKVKKLAAPPMSKESQRVVWHIPEIEEGKMITFCRQVSEGTLRPMEKWATTGGKEGAILDLHQVDAPESFFAGMGMNIDLEAKSLDELLSNDRIRSVVSRFSSVRTQYTGRIPGVGARLQYLHSKMIELINGRVESRFKLDDGGTLDLAWWASEATLGQYLKLASPPSDPLILEASQQIATLKLPIKEVDSNLLEALKMQEGGDGCHKTLQPLLEYLGVLGLIESVNIGAEEPGKGMTLAYRFAREGAITGWNEALEVQRAAEPYDFSVPEQVDEYWRQVSHDCVSLQAVDDLDELPLLQANMCEALRRKGAWYRHYHLLKPQQAFLFKTLSFGVDRSVIDNGDLLLRISKASMTPVTILKRYYQRRCAPEKSKKRSVGAPRASFPTAPQAQPIAKATARAEPIIEGTTLTARQANAIKKKALEVQRGKLAEFDEVLLACLERLQLEESARKVITDGLANIRREYGRGEAGLTLKKVGQMFDDVMKLHKQGEQAWNAIVNRRKATKASAAKEEELEGGKKKDASRSRKAAVEWTKAKDELLRDAIVILRCRDRHRNPANPQKNWKALNQIFPDPSATSLKNRYEHLCKAVGEQAYLDQLEAEWDKIWATHRDGDELDDLDPKSPTDFDLMAHIQFLRRHINKLAVADKVDSETGDPLPLDVSKMLGIYDYERPLGCDVYDAYSSLTRTVAMEISVEKRTTALYSRAFTLESGALFSGQEAQTQEFNAKRQLLKEKGIATAIVKIIQCTSDEDYDSNVATQLSLDNSNEEAIGRSIKELIDLKIIRKRTKEDREVPNRSFVYAPDYVSFYTEITLETLPFWRIVEGYQSILKDGQATVFRLSENEETAAYMTLLSQDQVKADIGLNVVEKIKMDKLFNAKLIQDHMLEMPIQLHLSTSTSRTDTIRRCAALLNSQPSQEPVLQWFEAGVESIATRVDKVWKQWIASLKGEKQAIAKRLESIFHDENSGTNGINKEELKSLCPSRYLNSLLQAAQGFSPPLVFQFGYEETFLISSRYLRTWTLGYKDGTFTFPYKWYNIHGQWIRQEWSQAIQFVLHASLTRPGITLAQLLLQCRIALDRMEVCRVVQYACEAGVIRKVLSSNSEIQGSDADWEARNDSEVALMAV
jgi:hypothetical protein